VVSSISFLICLMRASISAFFPAPLNATFRVLLELLTTTVAHLNRGHGAFTYIRRGALAREAAVPAVAEAD
jgi:hypothetical protein